MSRKSSQVFPVGVSEELTNKLQKSYLLLLSVKVKVCLFPWQLPRLEVSKPKYTDARRRGPVRTSPLLLCHLHSRIESPGAACLMEKQKWKN